MSPRPRELLVMDTVAGLAPLPMWPGSAAPEVAAVGPPCHRRPVAWPHTETAQGLWGSHRLGGEPLLYALQLVNRAGLQAEPCGAAQRRAPCCGPDQYPRTARGRGEGEAHTSLELDPTGRCREG